MKGKPDRTCKKEASPHSPVWEVQAESRFHLSRLPSENDPLPTTHGPRAVQNARSLSFVRLNGNTRWHHWQLVSGAECRRVQKIKHPWFQSWVQFRIVEVEHLPYPFLAWTFEALHSFFTLYSLDFRMWILKAWRRLESPGSSCCFVQPRSNQIGPMA
jgi:hypothetical protein